MVEKHREAVSEAKLQLKQIAGRSLARKEKAAKELTELEARRAEATGELDAGKSSSDSEVVREAESIERALDGQIELKRAEVDQAQHAYDEAVSELKKLDGTGRALEREILKAQVGTITQPSLFSQAPEDVALENVRHAVAELEAQAELDRELAGSRIDSREMARLDPKEVEARARRQLEELKARRQAEKDAADRPKKRTL